MNIQNEPVRVYVGGLLAAVVALLVAYGILSAAIAPLWIALGTAALAVPTVEKTRSLVSPIHKEKQ